MLFDLAFVRVVQLAVYLLLILRVRLARQGVRGAAQLERRHQRVCALHRRDA